MNLWVYKSNHEFNRSNHIFNNNENNNMINYYKLTYHILNTNL